MRKSLKGPNNTESRTSDHQVGPQPTSELTIFYDRTCSLCRNLGLWVESKGIPRVVVRAWQDYFADEGAHGGLAPELARLGPECPELRVRLAGQIFEGADAWELILREIPEMRALNWVAARLGLDRQLAVAADQIGKRTRRWCPSCGKFIRLKSASPRSRR